MIMHQTTPVKKYGLFALAIILLLSGGVTLVIGFNDFMARSLGVLMCVVSAYLVRVSNVRGLKGLRNTDSQNLNLVMPKRPGRAAWVWGVASAVALGISFIYLYKDALDGYNQVWPVYAFAGSALICASVWSYIVAKLMQRT